VRYYIRLSHRRSEPKLQFLSLLEETKFEMSCTLVDVST